MPPKEGFQPPDPTQRASKNTILGLGAWGLGFRDKGYGWGLRCRVEGFWVSRFWGLRGLGFRGLGLQGLAFRSIGFRGLGFQVGGVGFGFRI